MIDIDEANQTAVDRMMSARPLLRSVAPAQDVIPGMRERLLLHAGPPIAWSTRVRALERARHRRADLRGLGR
jgi:hypothetical protein